MSPSTSSPPSPEASFGAGAPSPAKPGPFEPAFLADLPYDPSVLLFDELLEVDVAESLVRCRFPTDGPMPITSAQRAHPLRHPSHVSGAMMVHATGMIGFVHAYYVLGLRHADGWIGYGTHLHDVKFRKLVPPGSPILASCRMTRCRTFGGKRLARYAIEFRHEGDVCYEGDQTAVWMRTGDGEPG